MSISPTLAQLQARLDDALVRIELLQNRQAILDALYRYHHAFIDLDLDSWLDCFCEDAVFRSTGTAGQILFELHGRAQLAAWFAQRLIDWPEGTEGYAQTNPRILQQGSDSARVRSIFITLQARAAPLGVRSHGEYVDDLVRCADGRWRISVKQGITRMTNFTPS